MPSTPTPWVAGCSRLRVLGGGHWRSPSPRQSPAIGQRQVSNAGANVCARNPRDRSAHHRRRFSGSPVRWYGRAEHGFVVEWDRRVAPASIAAFRRVGIADSIVKPAGRVTLRGHDVKLYESPMIRGLRGSDEFLCPGMGSNARCQTEKRRVEGDRRAGVQVVVVGSPPKSGTQIGQLASQPLVGLALARAVPERQHVVFARREVAGMCVAGVVGLSAAARAAPRRTGGSSPASRYRVRSDDRSATNSDLRTSASSRSRTANSSPEPATAQRRGQVEPAGEHRTALQQSLFGIVEQVVGPLHGMPQRLVALRARAAIRRAGGTGRRGGRVPR